MHDGSAGIQQLGPVEEPQARHRDPDLLVVERAGELLQGAGSDHRVGIQEQEHVARRLFGAAVAAAGEAEVLGRLQEPDAPRPSADTTSESLPPLSTTITSASPAPSRSERRQRASAWPDS